MASNNAAEFDQLLNTARQRNWALALILLGWLHLAAFLGCYYLTIVQDYHGSPGYVSIWLGELFGMGLIFQLCCGFRPSQILKGPLELLIKRIWVAYFVLAFNLASLNTLRGHTMFEFFPAMATLASFAFLMMSFVVHPHFYYAVLVMFASGLLMAANFLHAFLIFAVAWWIVLQGIGFRLWLQRRQIQEMAQPKLSRQKA